MKYIFYAFIGVIGVLIAMILGIYTLDLNIQPLQQLPMPDKHFVILVEDSKDNFWQTFKRSAEKSALSNQVFVEFIDIPAFDSDAAATAIERAVLSGVDAIALQPLSGSRTEFALDYARKSNIPILTFENDAFTLEGVPTVGSNSYLIGSTMSKLAIEASKGTGNVAIFINDRQSKDPRYKSLKLQGMLEALSPSRSIKISGIYSIDNSLLSVDKLTREVLNTHPEVDLILCTDERGTPAIAQALVDLGEVGRIQIIGFGNMEQTMRYIDRNVIYGTVCADGEAIGIEVIEQLNGMTSKDDISESTNTPIYTYTESNLDSYYKRYPVLKSEPSSN